MATHTWDLVPRGDKSTVSQTAGGAVGALSGVRVIVDDAVCTSKLEMIRELEIITQYLTADTWPPTL